MKLDALVLLAAPRNVIGSDRSQFTTPVGEQSCARYAALRGNGVAVATPNLVKSWIRNRHDNLLKLLSTNTAPFTVAGQANGAIATSRNLLALQGTAPINVLIARLPNGVLDVVQPSGSPPVSLMGLPNGVLLIRR